MIALVVADHFENVSLNNSYSADFFRITQNKELVRLDFSSNEEEIYNDKITEKEVNGALQQCKNTAAREDEIRYEML